MVVPVPRVVDVSHYNAVGYPDPVHNTALSGFRAAAGAGIWGVIHKATEGRTIRDAPMAARLDAAREAGMLVGTYDFIRPGDVGPQVANYLDYAKPGPADLVALDWEDNRVNAARAREWLERVADKLGRKPVVYSGNTAKEMVKPADAFFGSHRLWLAQYSSRPVVLPPWKAFWIWQFTGDGNGPQPHTIPGIAIPGNKGIDVNHYAGTREQLAAEWAS